MQLPDDAVQRELGGVPEVIVMNMSEDVGQALGLDQVRLDLREDAHL